MNLEGDVVFDSLPYIDGQLNLEEADALISFEMKSMGNPIVDQDEFELFKENPALLEAYERAVKGISTTSVGNGIATDRFRLPPPKDEKNGDWKSSVDNAKAQLEYQDGRSLNLELLSKHGPNHWKLGNYHLELINQALVKEMEEIKESIQQVNRERKQEQMIAGKSIKQMQQKRAELYSRTLQIRMANENLSKQLGKQQ